MVILTIIRGEFGLTRRQYRVCLLYFGYGKTQVEIARELRITQEAVAKHLCLARKKIPSLPTRRNFAKVAKKKRLTEWQMMGLGRDVARSLD